MFKLWSRTNFLRPIEMAGRAVTPETLPWIALQTWALEHPRIVATSRTLRISGFDIISSTEHQRSKTGSSGVGGGGSGVI